MSHEEPIPQDPMLTAMASMAPEDRLIYVLRHVAANGGLPLLHYTEVAHTILGMVEKGQEFRDAVGIRQIQRGQADIVRNFRHQILADDNFLVLDIGANTGDFSRAILDEDFKGRVVAFEPIRRHAEQMRKTYADDPRFSVEAVAVGDREGWADLNVCESETGLSSLLPISRGYHYFNDDFRQDQQSVERVQTTTVDKYMRRHPELARYENVALKVDTQGFEYPVFCGARKLLKSGRVKAVLVEVMACAKYERAKTYKEIFDYLHALRFNVYDLLPFYREIDMQFQCSHRGRLTEFDCMFVSDGFLASRARAAA